MDVEINVVLGWVNDGWLGRVSMLFFEVCNLNFKDGLWWLDFNGEGGFNENICRF